MLSQGTQDYIMGMRAKAGGIDCLVRDGVAYRNRRWLPPVPLKEQPDWETLEKRFPHSPWDAKYWPE